jgi:hypothetical protein
VEGNTQRKIIVKGAAMINLNRFENFSLNKEIEDLIELDNELRRILEKK